MPKEYIEREAADIQLFAKRNEWQKHWREYLEQHRSTADYSTAEQAVDNWLRGYGEAIDDYIAISDCLPAADVVEVVRCKDCKYSMPTSDTEPIYTCCCPEVYGIGSRGSITCRSTHYCGYGERKDDAE